MKTYSRVNFSPCIYLAILGRSRIQRKLNQPEKFQIYDIFGRRVTFIQKDSTPMTIYLDPLLVRINGLSAPIFITA